MRIADHVTRSASGILEALANLLGCWQRWSMPGSRDQGPRALF